MIAIDGDSVMVQTDSEEVEGWLPYIEIESWKEHQTGRNFARQFALHK